MLGWIPLTCLYTQEEHITPLCCCPASDFSILTTAARESCLPAPGLGLAPRIPAAWHFGARLAGSLQGVSRSWEVFWLCWGLSKQSSFGLGIGAVPEHTGDAMTTLLLLLAGGVSCFLWLRQRLLFFPPNPLAPWLAYHFSHQWQQAKNNTTVLS